MSVTGLTANSSSGLGVGKLFNWWAKVGFYNVKGGADTETILKELLKSVIPRNINIFIDYSYNAEKVDDVRLSNP